MSSIVDFLLDPGLVRHHGQVVGCMLAHNNFLAMNMNQLELNRSFSTKIYLSLKGLLAPCAHGKHLTSYYQKMATACSGIEGLNLFAIPTAKKRIILVLHLRKVLLC